MLDLLRSETQGKSQRPYLIQCGERSSAGIGPVTFPSDPSNPVLYSHIDHVRVTNSGTSTCAEGDYAYTAGSVIVLCPGFWLESLTKDHPGGRIVDLSIRNSIKTSYFQIGDSINLFQDFRSFRLFHELMHWFQFNVKSGTIGIDDRGGYSIEGITKFASISGSDTSRSAQIYPFLAAGNTLLYK